MELSDGCYADIDIKSALFLKHCCLRQAWSMLRKRNILDHDIKHHETNK